MMQKRPLRPFEQGAHLHVLDWAHTTARYRLQAAGHIQVKAAAKAAVKASTDGTLRLPALEAAVHGELMSLYALGHQTVRSELDHQASGDRLPVGLAQPATQLATEATRLATTVAGSPRTGQLTARARLIAQAAAHAVWQAIQRGRLQGITSKRQLRQAGITAGHAALGQAATHHAGGVINAGRRDAAMSMGRKGGFSASGRIIGARYTSVLDKNTCGPCGDADTGQLLALTDPALVHPPNPACMGGDRCRCILVYQLDTETTPNTAPNTTEDDGQPDEIPPVRRLPVAQVGVGAS